MPSCYNKSLRLTIFKPRANDYTTKQLIFLKGMFFLKLILMIESAQSCLTPCNLMNPHLRLPGSSFHGILQARILEWVAILFSTGSSQPRNQVQVSRIAGRFFTTCATRQAPDDNDYITMYLAPGHVSPSQQEPSD